MLISIVKVFVISSICLIATIRLSYCQTLIGGNYVGDHTLTLSDSPYQLNSDLYVRNGILTIESGVVINLSAYHFSIGYYNEDTGSVDANGVRFYTNYSDQRGIRFYHSSDGIIQNSTMENVRANIIDGYPIIKNCTFEFHEFGPDNCIWVHNGSPQFIDNLITHTRNNNNCVAIDIGDGQIFNGTPIFRGNTIEKYRYGFKVYNGSPVIEYNSFEDIYEFGIYNDSSLTVIAENNWWGDPSGPTHPSNLEGQGVAVSDNVDFDPWYTGNVAIYNISGVVVGADSVLMTLSGDASESQIINDGEQYSFTVSAGGNYTITPSNEGYSFDPQSITYSNIDSDKSQNFSAHEIVQTYNISGIIQGCDQVLVTLSGDKSESQFINDGGQYSFTVDAGGNYTITPTKTGYSFDPSNKLFRDISKNESQDFKGEDATCPIYITGFANFGVKNAINRYYLSPDTLIVAIDYEAYKDVQDLRFFSSITTNEGSFSITEIYDENRDKNGVLGIDYSLKYNKEVVIGKCYLPPTVEDFTVTVDSLYANDVCFTENYKEDFSNYSISREYFPGDQIYSRINESYVIYPYNMRIDGYGFENGGFNFQTFISYYKKHAGYLSAGYNTLLSLFAAVGQWGGMCFGMAATSNLYFENYFNKPESIRDIATHEMQYANPDVANEITKYMLVSPLSIFLPFEDDNSTKVEMACDLLKEGKLPILCMCKDSKYFGGHAVSVYRVFIKHRTGEAYFCIYDNNHLHKQNYATMSSLDNYFNYLEYNLGAILYAPPVIDIADAFNILENKMYQSLYNNGLQLIAHACPVKSLITDKHTGNKIGFINGYDYVNEIEGAFVQTIDTGDNDYCGYVYYLPENITYDIEYYGLDDGHMRIEALTPVSTNTAKHIVFENVPVMNGMVAKISNVDLEFDSDVTLKIDEEGDGTFDIEIVTDAENSLPIAVEERPETENSLSIDIPYPNPFNTMINIHYDLPESLPVTIKIYDILGRQIDTLYDSIQEPGQHDITWDGTDEHGEFVSSGVYFFSIKAGSFYEASRIVFIK